MTAGSTACRATVRTVSGTRWRPTRVEIALAIGVAATGLAELWVPFSSRQGSGSYWVSSAAVCLVAATLLCVRRQPLLALLGLLGTQVVAHASGGTFVLFYGQFVPFLITVFFVARYETGRLRWLGAGVAAVALFGIDVFIPELSDPNEVLFHWVVTALVFGAGYGLFRWENRARDATRRAVEAEVRAAERAMAAVVDERTRIARELHDIVAHSVTSMVVQAGAAEQAGPGEAAFVAEALAGIRRTGTDALAEMRRLVSILRDDSEEGARGPQPQLAAVPGLVRQLEDSGVRTRLTVRGEQRELPPGLDLAAYRIVQEALTNVRRHSSATQCDVYVTYRPGEVLIQVSDNGTGPSASPAEGHGIIGMRERAHLYAGELTASAHERGGYEVRARLPVPT
jgi:signal transduction histidine kinase